MGRTLAKIARIALREMKFKLKPDELQFNSIRQVIKSYH